MHEHFSDKENIQLVNSYYFNISFSIKVLTYLYYMYRGTYVLSLIVTVVGVVVVMSAGGEYLCSPKIHEEVLLLLL